MREIISVIIFLLRVYKLNYVFMVVIDGLYSL